MSNLGVYPVDMTSQVGSLRAMVGDVNGTDNGDGTADYEYFADSELTAIVAQSPSLNRQMSLAYLKMYAILALQAVSISTDDLRVDNTYRATQFKNLATIYGGFADDEDDLAGGADIFMLAGGTSSSNCECLEGGGVYCRCGVAF